MSLLPSADLMLTLRNSILSPNKTHDVFGTKVVPLSTIDDDGGGGGLLTIVLVERLEEASGALQLQRKRISQVSPSGLCMCVC